MDRSYLACTASRLPRQHQASYRSISPGLSARKPSSCFDADARDAKVGANVGMLDNIAVEHARANAHASAVMTDDEDQDKANDGHTDVCADFAFGAINSNVDFDRTPLLSPLSPPPPPLISPPSAAAGNPI